MDKISESGTIGTDGRLRMPMERLNEFFAANKGMRVVASFEVAAPGSTKAQQAYFYRYILPTMQQALKETGERMSEEQTEMYLFMYYPGVFRKLDGTMIEHGRDLSKSQMSEFIDWIKQYAAENLSVYIEDSTLI